MDEFQSAFELAGKMAQPARAPFFANAGGARPRRTYAPQLPSQDPADEYPPLWLSKISGHDPYQWEFIKGRLENFGQKSGLFDEIGLSHSGKTKSDSPFQVNITKYGKKYKGRERNLIDVGYGVSQALPLAAELLSPEPPPLFLLQQPEAYLHPRAQAELGTLFCSIAGPERQLVVETHSDFILDRVLMDIRDKTTDLSAEDVSILYFEPNDTDVTIHSLRVDDRAAILDPPDSYRRFFMDELRRSVGL